MAVTLGTSGVVFAATESPLIEPQGRLHAFCHAVAGRWHLMGVMLSAAGSLQWYHDKLARDKISRSSWVKRLTFLPGVKVSYSYRT